MGMAPTSLTPLPTHDCSISGGMSGHHERVLSVVRDGGKAVSITVDGGSMHPLLMPGDRVLVDPARDPRPGSIVTFRLGASFVVHRALAVDDKSLTELGDAVRRRSVVKRDQVLGVAVLVRRADRELDLSRRPCVWHETFTALWMR